MNAKIVNVTFDFETMFLTQEAKSSNNTGLQSGAEMAPAVSIKVQQLSL